MSAVRTLLLSAGALLVGAAPASAAPPDVFVEHFRDGPVVDEVLTAACGQPVLATAEGSVRFRHWSDEDGELVHSVGTVHARVVASGPAGDVEWHVGFSQVVVYDAAGDVARLSGRLGPGQNTGHLVIEVHDPDDPFDDVVVRASGHLFEPEALCEQLVGASGS